MMGFKVDQSCVHSLYYEDVIGRSNSEWFDPIYESPLCYSNIEVFYLETLVDTCN